MAEAAWPPRAPQTPSAKHNKCVWTLVGHQKHNENMFSNHFGTVWELLEKHFFLPPGPPGCGGGGRPWEIATSKGPPLAFVFWGGSDKYF